MSVDRHLELTTDSRRVGCQCNPPLKTPLDSCTRFISSPAFCVSHLPLMPATKSPPPAPNTLPRQASLAVRWPGANLKTNPFGELTRQERSDLAVVSVQPMIDVLCDQAETQRNIPDDNLSSGSTSLSATLQPRRAYQLIGRCGRGKSSHLLAMWGQFPSAAYVYLPQWQPCPVIPEAPLLIIDEAQRLPFKVRRKLFSSGIPLLLATHRNLTPWLRYYGYRSVTQRVGATISADKIQAIFNRRIEASRRLPDQPVPHLSTHDAAMLIQRFGTNIRSMENYLYEIVQQQVNDHGQMRFID
ncbi:hypothetical protein SV7mr_42180 [Stieleria bergensis]|uniref:Uncharacterized protein n=1 Tax=Stieleria bergensis TaxID=2528025 RepID=A0A517SZV6_9BACT|nr:hypothetical protein SV7mr_42180 [Planctomycetes bacterium SV_7m_r]